MSIKLLVLSFVIIASAGDVAHAATLSNPGKGIVITAPGISYADAKAFATSRDKLPLSDYLDANRPGEELENQLKRRLEKAQRAWLGGETESARSEFRALAELSLKADWREAQREVLQTAYLRLAQSAQTGTERESWLESGARLYMDLNPNPELFPPPLLAEFDSMKKRLDATSTDIDLRDVFPDFRYLIVDGRKVELATESRLQLTKGLHRLTAYSDSHETITEFLTAAQLRVLRVSPPSLTEGTCQTAKLRPRSALPSSVDVEVFSGSNCEGGLTRLLQASRVLSQPQSTENFGPLPPTGQTKSASRTWLWIAGGALITAAGYAMATRSTTPEPTHRSGF